MLACARIGAMHSVVFAGFSAEALRSRVEDSGAKLLITADEAPRGGRRTPLKTNADKALAGSPASGSSSSGAPGATSPGTPTATSGSHEAMERCAIARPWRWAPRTRSSSSTPPARPASPRACVHTTGGYLVYAAMTHEYVFDYHDGDIYWCTADVGWVTGHSYIVYGPSPTARHADVRGRADLARRRALLAGLREARGQHLLHRPHRDPRAHGPGPRVGRQTTSHPCASSARSASRSTPRPGTGTTRSSARANARSSTPGGRPRPAAS